MDAAEREKQINLVEVYKDLAAVNEQIALKTKEHNEFFEGIGVENNLRMNKIQYYAKAQFRFLVCAE